MTSDRTVQYRYLGFISLVLVFAVIHWLKPVLLPLVIALFTIAVALPINVWLNRIFPKNASYVLSYVVLTCIISFFVYISYLAMSEFVVRLPEYEEQFVKLIERVNDYLRAKGIPVPHNINMESLHDYSTPLIATFYDVLAQVALIIALVILGLPELVFWEDKLHNCLGKSDGRKWYQAGKEAAISFQKYMTVMTGIGLLAAALTTIFCWLVGLDFALLWGLIAFIMNFIPVLGALVALILPILTALMQFNDPATIWSIVVGLTIIQFFMGYVIDPKFQGKFLSMSPVIILLSIAFWSIIWGPAGAFLAVPLTHIIMIAGQQFPNSKSVACLLSADAGRKPK